MSLIRRRLLDDAIKKTASGNPIAVQSVARMRPGIKIFGRSTQDGTPSPENPIQIVSAGDNGTVIVTLSNDKNSAQSLTFNTPNGLPGIPVDAGGNYTDKNGQQWFCDEVDFYHGIYTSNVFKYTVDNITLFENIPEIYPNTCRVSIDIYGGINSLNASCILCNIAIPSQNGAVKNTCRIFNNNRIFIFVDRNKYPDEESLLSEMGDNPIIFVLPYSTPVITPIQSEEMQKYQLIHTYSPITTVSASGDAGIEFTYKTKKIGG